MVKENRDNAHSVLQLNMDIRKFFGSPPGKKGSAPPVQKAKENLKETNNNTSAKKNENRPKEKTKDIAKNRDASRDRKSDKKAKDVEPDTTQQSKNKKINATSSINGSKKPERRSSEEIEIIESDDEKVTRSSKKRKPSRENSSSKKKKPKRVSLEDSDDDQFDEIVRKPKSKSSSRGKKGIVFDSDSEEEPIRSKSKRKSSEYQSVYIVDSDEEAQKKKKPSPLKAFMTKKTPAKPTAEAKKSLEEKAKRTPVSAADFFGGGSVQRVERKPANKRKLETEKEPTNDDSEIHDDDDFEETLAQLDEQEHKAKKTKVDQPSTPDKLSSPSKGSLSSKLSSLAKSSKVLAEDTPEVKKFSKQRSSPRKAVRSETTAPSKSPVKDTKKTPSKQPESKSPVKTPSPDKTPLEKKGSNSGYRSYLHRDGPQSLGAKEFPEGAANCLEGSTFVITGVLESFERDETKTFIEKHGGKVTTSLSKKTSYVVVGRDAGESKLNKAAQFGTKQLDEDGLLALVKALPGKRSKYEIQAEEEAKKERLKTPVSEKTKSLQKFSAGKSPSVKLEPESPSQSFSRSQSSQEGSQSSQTDQPELSLLWVDKYKPTSLKRIIGQTGDKSNANKLSQWLKSWHRNRALGKKPTGGMFGKDDGSGHRAALLSGPPGVGKTTTATLVCQEAGFSYVELNASDTRSKKTLENMVAESLNNQTLVDFMGDSKKNSPDLAGKKHCIIMDEVDGVAGNEDRGGIQELIQLIKGTRIPIICICNDRNHQKMRSLVNYCFDLRFYKPRVEQIKGAMMSIIFKEGLSIPPPALNEIILAANQDVRQVIHNLSMWCATSKTFTFEQAKSDSEKAQKDLKIGPFDVCRKVFEGGEEKRKMSIIDKSDLFFNDYSIAPLFVQENYIHVTPYSAKGSVGRHLSQLAKASDSLCTGDLIEKKIRSQSKWNLLPMEAIFASVIPGEVMQGGMSGMIAFPSWLSKNSTFNKNDRILQELHTHMSLHISSDKRGLNLDYLPFLRNSLTEPLVRRENEGVRDVIDLMDSYNIIKDDFDNIMDVSKWPNSSDPFSSLSSKTKAAFTRAYNKESHLTPYSIGGGTKKKKGGGGGASDELLPGEGEEGGTVAVSDEEDDSVGGDGMIKVKNPSATSAAGSKGKGKGKGAGKSTEPKGKGRGKGKGKS